MFLSRVSLAFTVILDVNVTVHVGLAARGRRRAHLVVVASSRVFAETALPVEVAVGGKRLVVIGTHLQQESRLGLGRFRLLGIKNRFFFQFLAVES